MAYKKKKKCLPRGGKCPSKEEKSTPGSPMSESDNKMNNISSNYSSHNYIEIHSRMHAPNCPMHYSIKFFSEEHASNPLAIKLNSFICTACQRKRDVLQYLSTISKLFPKFKHEFLP